MKATPKRRSTRKAVKPAIVTPSHVAWLEDRLAGLITQHQQLSRQVAQMEKSHRGEAHDIQADQRKIAAALHRIEKQLNPPPVKGEMVCSVCKKCQPALQFTYETADGQLCEGCWNWHERVRQTQGAMVAH